MAYFGQDKNQNLEPVQKEHITRIDFVSGGFYPFLKLLLQRSCGIDERLIYIRAYGQNDPFLDQSSEGKVYVENFMHSTPLSSGKLQGDGRVSIWTTTRYNVFFVNDLYRSPVLFESAIKVYNDDLVDSVQEFRRVYGANHSVAVPEQISVGTQKMLNTEGLYPLVYYDVFLAGWLTYNLSELKNTPFIDSDFTIKLKKEN